MAYGLQIDNGTGKRTVDSEYQGIYYIGKDSISSPGQLSVPGYTDSTIPPLVFLKLPTTGSQFTSMTSLTYSAPGSTGGAATVTLSTIPSNTVYVFAPAQEQTACENLGGTYHHDGLGGCRLNGTTQVETDLSDTTESCTVSLSCADGVINAGATAVVNAGYGWSVSDTSTLDASPGQGRGWHPFNTSTSQYVSEDQFAITIDSLASGWVAQMNGDFTDTVTGYFYGIGGAEGASNNYGLELRDSSSNLTFSSNRPPPVIRGVDNISFTALDYSAGWSWVGSPPAGSSTDANETISYPTTSTAMYSTPLMPTSLSTGGSQSGVPAAGLGENYMGDYTAGLRFKISGANIVGLTKQSKLGTTITVGQDTCGEPYAMVLHSPFWDITSGSVSPTGTLQTCTGALGSRPTWDVNQDCTFIDTTIPDALPY